MMGERGDRMNQKDQILFLSGAPKDKLLGYLVKKGFHILCVVVPKSQKYEEKYTPLTLKAAELKIPVLSILPKDISEGLKGLSYDILLSCGYPFSIPKDVLTKARYAINIHPTLLPQHRGRYLHYVLLNRDEFSGVTAHLMEEKLDSGPIIKQVKFKVSPFDTVKSLLRKSAELEMDLASKVLFMAQNNQVKSQIQQDSIATEHFKKRTPADSQINPNKKLIDLFYEIRAYDPIEYPAFFYLNGKKVFVKVCRAQKPENELDMI